MGWLCTCLKYIIHTYHSEASTPLSLENKLNVKWKTSVCQLLSLVSWSFLSWRGYQTLISVTNPSQWKWRSFGKEPLQPTQSERRPPRLLQSLHQRRQRRRPQSRRQSLRQRLFPSLPRRQSRRHHRARRRLNDRRHFPNRLPREPALRPVLGTPLQRTLQLTLQLVLQARVRRYHQSTQIHRRVRWSKNSPPTDHSKKYLVIVTR